VLEIAGLEGDVPRHVGDPDAVAVRADAADDATDETPRAWLVRCAEAERVQQRDGPRAHREDVAEDAAHAGGRALERLDRRRMVVALHFERAEETVAKVDRSGVLTRADSDARSGRRKSAEELLRVLVGAVLAPHRAEHRPLKVVRLAT